MEVSMNEFIKPKTVFVSDSEYIQNLVNVNLKKTYTMMKKFASIVMAQVW